MTFTKPRNRKQAVALAGVLRRFGTTTNSARHIRAADDLVGACQTDDGCELLSRAACDEKGGEYGGDDTVCADEMTPDEKQNAAWRAYRAENERHGKSKASACCGTCATASAKPQADFLDTVRNHARTQKLTFTAALRKLTAAFPAAHETWVKAQHRKAMSARGIRPGD